MYFKSKKISLLILGITALTLSRAMFALFDDPEGPNLLVVTVMAGIIYLPSVATYLMKSLTVRGLTRLLLVVLVQVVITAGFYFALK